MAAVTAYLGLGSNLGPRGQNLATAVSRLCRGRTSSGVERDPQGRNRRLSSRGLEPLRASSVYETAPWGYARQPHFLNCVLEVRTSLPPIQLLEAVKGVEEEMGRQPGFRYGPRLIDVDILLYGDMAVDLPGLKIPHPRLHQRAFALIPLAELAPGLTHPALRVAIGELAGRAEGREGVQLWGPPPDFSCGDHPGRPS